MEFETFIKVFLVCSLGAMSPGPSWILIINNALFKGKISGYITSIGHGLGIATYALIANLSIGVIIQSNIFIFNTVKLFSIIFLIYLGYKSLVSSSINIHEKKLTDKFQSFLEGFSLAILNPKVLIWFIAVYSQFMSPNNELIFNFILIITAGIVDMGWYCLLVFFVVNAGLLPLIQDKILIFQRSIGSIFIVIGLVLFITMII
jgi:threonine/homoserine/homoserine lactone efflux protein